MHSNALRRVAALMLGVPLMACGGGGGGGGGQSLDLVAALSAPASVLPGETFTYTVSVTVSRGTARTVGAMLALPAGVTPGAISGGGILNGSTVTWAPAATVSPEAPLAYTVMATAGPVGPLDATLTATTASTEPMGNNNSSRRVVIGFEALATLAGEAAGDQFGFVADGVGDLDADGRPDFVVGAPFNDAGGNNAGRAYVYSGATATLLFSMTGTAGQRLGLAVAGAGDVDDDGTDDVIVGAPGVGNGAARVYSGDDGSLLLSLTGPSVGSSFGTVVAGAGDVNSDGFDDLLVGAPSAASGVGQAFVINGETGATIRSHTGPAGTNFGHGVAGIGDVDGDLVPDYAIGGGVGTGGLVEVRSGADGALLYTVNALAGGISLGSYWIDAVGDVDNDGSPDLYIADINEANNRGRGYLVSGDSGTIIRTRAGEAAGDYFGIARHGGHDVNGDNVPDLFVAAYHSAEGVTLGGKAYVISGATGALLRTLTGTALNQTLGYDAVQLGDVDGDGLVDYLLTGGQEVLPGTGSVIVIKGTLLP